MIEQSDILSFGRYTRYSQPFSGSYKGMRFMIQHPKAAEGEDDVFKIAIWPEPYGIDNTDEEDIIRNEMMFSEDNFYKILTYLNEMYELYRERWENAIR